MEETYHKWYAQYLSIDFEMLVFGKCGYPIILFPTANGRYFESKDDGLIASAEELIDSGKIKIYCPDSIDSHSWYNYSIPPADRVKNHIAYEKTILSDVIQFAKYETGIKAVGVAGSDFGAYHALNIAFKHPDKIDSLVCMGGFYDIKQFIFGFYDESCYFNNPPDYMGNLDDPWYLEKIKKMKIILGTGARDLSLEENKRISRILSSKEIEHWLDVGFSSGQDWQVWKEMFPVYLKRILE